MGDGPIGDEVIAQGGVMQQVKTAYTTAISVQQPRNIELVTQALMAESRMAGELFYYGWGAGKNRIEGGSVHLATTAARCWGNCAITAEPVQDAGDSWIFTTTFIDLETGFTISRQFRQSKKSEVYGKHDSERKDDIRFQIGQSKSARNVIFNALPKWLIDKARVQAQAGVREKLQRYIDSNGIAAAVDIVVKELAKHGIRPEAICAKYSIASPAALQVEHLVALRGDITALQTGQDTSESLYPDVDGDALAAQVNKKAAKPKPKSNKKPTKPEPKPAVKPDPADEVVDVESDAEPTFEHREPPTGTAEAAATAMEHAQTAPVTEPSPADDAALEKESLETMQLDNYLQAIEQATDNPKLAELQLRAEKDRQISSPAFTRIKKAATARSMDLG